MTAVLIIEDNPITRKLVRFTLETAGYEVIDAEDGAAGVETLRARTPALVLVDLLLPDMDGFELLNRLRELPNSRDVPILAFSGLLSPYDESRLADVGFDDVVSKPIEPSRLVQIVRAYVPLRETPVAAPANGAKTLVVADDDPVQRKAVALRLQRAGYKVELAGDGEEALARARRVHPYAIVSDVLMPRLDGFGLCLAVRGDPEIANTTVVLISNSYLDAADKALARRVGADEMLVRTPELRDVIDLLQRPTPSAPRRPPRETLDPALERERLQRMMSQLERQVALHAGIAQRCSLLSAELSVLSGISEAVATEHDIEGALQQILATCFDAGGISLGTMYLIDDGELRGVRFGAMESWPDADIESFFGHRAVLDRAIATQTAVVIPTPDVPNAQYPDLLERAGARSLTIAPLGHRGQPLGALVTMSRSLDSQPEDRITFTQAVAGQISLALALARSFQAKDSSERAARANATVLRSTLESMAEGVVVFGENGDVAHWNHAATDILRIPLPDWSKHVGLAEFPLARALAGERLDRAEVFVAGAETWLSINARPLGDEPGGERGAVAVFRDVTTERAAHARMLVNERMASLGTLAAGVGHEINNPLMSVIGNLEMAMSDLKALQRKHGEIDVTDMTDELRDAKEAAERVRDIVRDLKLFSRSDEESRTEVDVVRVMESSLRMVWNEIRHRAKLVRAFDEVPPVYANESRLGQVFLNLVVNAAQAIPEGRESQNEIRVATSRAADGRVRVEVRDTGCGMTAEVVDKIFTPFFTTKPIGVGTGLGLAICHQLIAALGGEIVVESMPGEGSTFAVLLPATRSRPVGPAAERPRPSGRRGAILIIDDDVVVATTIKRALSRQHEVVVATVPAEAIRLVESGRHFDVILCDLMMPNVTGMDVHAQLEKRAPEVARRMAFITGGAFTEQARAFLETTQNPSLTKPIDIDALRSFIDERLATRSQP